MERFVLHRWDIPHSHAQHSLAIIALQIYVEVERARITRQLARMQEMDGLLNEASATIQEV